MVNIHIIHVYDEVCYHVKPKRSLNYGRPTSRLEPGAPPQSPEQRRKARSTAALSVPLVAELPMTQPSSRLVLVKSYKWQKVASFLSRCLNGSDVTNIFYVFSSPEPKALVSYCHSAPSVRRRPSIVRKLFTFSVSSPEPLDGFGWNLVGIKY